MVDWVELGEELMRSSRKARGYSYEAMGRQLNVASKTYERYEKAGRVPRHMLDRVAEVLDLELERPARAIVAITDATQQTVEDSIQELVERVGELADAQTRMFALLEGVLEEALPARRVPASRRRVG